MKVAVLASVASLAGAFMAPTSSLTRVASPSTALRAEPYFEEATSKFKSDFPVFNSYGWGVSTKAERWNGRHAMFGWLFIICTGYAQAHGLIPDADKVLDIKEWGTLAQITPRVSTITNERAIILVANIHALMVSLCAAFCPLPFQDKLLLEPGEEDEPPAGFVPPYTPGINANAEIINGRLAMLGIVAVSAYSIAADVPFLTVVDQLIGGKLYSF